MTAQQTEQVKALIDEMRREDDWRLTAYADQLDTLLASLSETPEKAIGADPALIAEAERLLAGITPDDELVQRSRYDHGGGRMYRAVPRTVPFGHAEDRTLILDAYQEGDREFYFSAARIVRSLLAALSSSQTPPEEK